MSSAGSTHHEYASARDLLPVQSTIVHYAEVTVDAAELAEMNHDAMQSASANAALPLALNAQIPE
jgi:hypothetical protein